MMKYNISKELFEEVRGSQNDKILSLINDKGDSIEVNNFFFKCKEWVLKQGCGLDTRVSNKIIKTWIRNGAYSPASFEAKTEQQTVFDACEWILERK